MDQRKMLHELANVLSIASGMIRSAKRQGSNSPINVAVLMEKLDKAASAVQRAEDVVIEARKNRLKEESETKPSTPSHPTTEEKKI
jgi:hypothetical protein